MAALNMSIEHGQSWDVARANFATTIQKAREEHRRWIHKVTWSPDRTSAVLSGPSYEIELSLDALYVHARGRVPLAVKLIERPVRGFIERTLAKERDSRA